MRKLSSRFIFAWNLIFSVVVVSTVHVRVSIQFNFHVFNFRGSGQRTVNYSYAAKISGIIYGSMHFKFNYK